MDVEAVVIQVAGKICLLAGVLDEYRLYKDFLSIVLHHPRLNLVTITGLQLGIWGLCNERCRTAILLDKITNGKDFS